MPGTPTPGLIAPAQNHARIQAADAGFGLTDVPEQPITSWFGLTTDSALPALAGVPTFDDSVSYIDDVWQPWFRAPTSWSTYVRYSIDSVLNPHYGLKITVKGGSPTAGRIAVDFSGFHMPE